METVSVVNSSVPISVRYEASNPDRDHGANIERRQGLNANQPDWASTRSDEMYSEMFHHPPT